MRKWPAMAKKQDVLDLTEDQVLYFRARRGHLAGPGADGPVEAARAILGAQSQQLEPGLLALSQRTAGRPTAEELKARLYEDKDLVRFWGQRDTIHIYDPRDWPTVIAAMDRWQHGGRRGVMPPDDLVEKARAHLHEAEAPQTRSDLFHLVPEDFLAEALEKVNQYGGGGRDGALRLAAGRLLWSLALRGDACAADKIGAETAYAARSWWLPELPWPEPAPKPHEAATELARRYLGVNGPATAQDVAHFFKATVTNARKWLKGIEASHGLLEIRCEGRDGLVALPEDRSDLLADPPGGFSDWPVRLLPLWDTLLMGHKDKSWTVPNEDDRKRVWRKAAYVAAPVIARGRVVAIWTAKALAKKLRVEVEPLSLWRQTQHASGVRREAREVAAHVGLPEAEVRILS